MEICPAERPWTSKTLSSPHPILSSFPLFNPLNYFHWVGEGLSRVVTLLDQRERQRERRGESEGEGERERDFRVLVPSKSSFVLESLALLGIDTATQVCMWVWLWVGVSVFDVFA